MPSCSRISRVDAAFAASPPGRDCRRAMVG